MYSYKITSLTLNDGTIIKPAALTVLIGPNNVGKSQALKDIANLTSRLAQAPRDGVIIKRISSQLPQSVAAFLEAYPSLARVRDKSGAMHYNGLNTTLTDYYRISGGSDPRENERDFASQNSTEKKHEWISSEFGMGLIAFLTTEHRLQLVKEANNSDHDDGADNLLQAFYNAGSAKAQDVSNQVSQVFREKRIALDFTTGRKLRIRVASDFSDVPPDPRDARAIMQSKLLLDEQGDGIRSFVGMVVALETLDRPLILIDEPEAFLHPPQAYAIGRFIAEEARTGRQIIVATHSTDVLRGITSVTPNADIIRIDRVNDANSFRALSQKKLKEVILDPLLSSSRVLDGLFYPGAIITEGDRDSRFFQAVLQKLPGTIDTHFVNASSKQAVPQIMAVYSDMGIRHAGIVHFDILRVEADWQQALDRLGFSDEHRSLANNIRNEIAQFVKQEPANERIRLASGKIAEIVESLRSHEASEFASPEERQRTEEKFLKSMERRLQEAAHVTAPWNDLKKHGCGLLPEAIQPRFDELFELCAAKGFFILPTGELESMLTAYGIEHTTNKKDWIKQALQLVPSLDVDLKKHPWKFVKTILDHLSLG